MSVRLSEEEAWAFVAGSHTGIFTTLRADGMPVALPVWFVVLDRTVCMGSPSRAKKVARVRHDPRASFLVERGLAWSELEAVSLTGTVAIVDDEERCARIDAALDLKYAGFRTESAAMPDDTRAHYAGRTFLQFVPDERILSWDNHRIELRPEP